MDGQVKSEPKPVEQPKLRDYYTSPKVPDRPDRSADGDYSGSSWSGERWAGRNWGGGRDR